VSPAIWYLLVLIPYTAFVVLYATRSPWWETGMGRSLLLSKTVIAALSWNAVLALWLGEYPGRDIVRGLIVGAAIVAGWSQLYLLVREQHAARHLARCHTSPGDQPGIEPPDGEHRFQPRP
jgi:hypothetical protein